MVLFGPCLPTLHDSVGHLPLNLKRGFVIQAKVLSNNDSGLLQKFFRGLSLFERQACFVTYLLEGFYERVSIDCTYVPVVISPDERAEKYSGGDSNRARPTFSILIFFRKSLSFERKSLGNFWVVRNRFSR